MIKSMYSGVSAIKANQAKMDTIANNVANSSTTGFKKSIERFQDALSMAITSANSPTNTIGGSNIGQVGLGVKVSEISKLMNQGALQLTGRPTDLAINGEGFFMVGSGLPTGVITIDPANKNILTNASNIEILYSRDGSLSIDSQGYLVTADGLRVLGYQADLATGTVSNTNLSFMSIPDVVNIAGTDYKTLDFNISKDGTITASLENGTNVVLGQLSLATFTNKEGLDAQGNNKFRPTVNTGNPQITNVDAQIIQNAIEMSNVDLSEEFVDMIVTTRSFQAASKIITTSDDLLQEIINLKR